MVNSWLSPLVFRALRPNNILLLTTYSLPPTSYCKKLQMCKKLKGFIANACNYAQQLDSTINVVLYPFCHITSSFSILLSTHHSVFLLVHFQVSCISLEFGICWWFFFSPPSGINFICKEMCTSYVYQSMSSDLGIRLCNQTFPRSRILPSPPGEVSLCTFLLSADCYPHKAGGYSSLFLTLFSDNNFF